MIMKHKSNLSLAVFTNCTADCLEEPTIYDSLGSLTTAFQDQDFATLIIYVDPKPSIKSYAKYVKKLKGYGFYTVKVKNKEDAYRDALEACETKYLMTIGDDWYYDDDHIKNSLQDFTYWMTKHKLSILALNDEPNYVSDFITPGRKFCKVTAMKDWPQIVNVTRMRQIMILHNIAESRKVLCELDEVAVYGGYDKMETVKRLRKEKSSE